MLIFPYLSLPENPAVLSKIRVRDASTICDVLHMSDSHAALHLDLIWSAGQEPRRPIEPELFTLLEAIRETGKLTSATARVGLPYRQAWGLITKWSGLIGQPLVTKEQGR